MSTNRGGDAGHNGNESTLRRSGKSPTVSIIQGSQYSDLEKVQKPSPHHRFMPVLRARPQCLRRCAARTSKRDERQWCPKINAMLSHAVSICHGLGPCHSSRHRGYRDESMISHSEHEAPTVQHRP